MTSAPTAAAAAASQEVAAVQAAGTTSKVLKTVKDVFAGTCGGIAVTMVGHPFDTLKVRLQTQPANNPIYAGVFDCARKTVQWEGVGGLYKGVQSPLAGQMFFRAAQFAAFGSSKRYFGTNPDGTRKEFLSDTDCFLAGAATGLVSAFFEGPIDFYKSQLQVQIIRQNSIPGYKPPFTGIVDCVRQTLVRNSITGPYQGLGPTLLRNVPANAVYLGSFEIMKREAAKSYGCTTQELPAWVVLGSAGLGGVLYWTSIYPVDVIKSAMMCDAITKSEREYPNMVVTASKLWREGGITRFYKGFAPCLMRAAPANAAMLYTVDKVNGLLNNH